MSKNLRKGIAWVAVNLMRLLLACTFIFSGIVKLIDPHGTEYKIQDYLNAFALPELALPELALLLALVLSVCEVTYGILLLYGVRLKRTVAFMLLFMVLATPLTLYIAMANPVGDCGCFGDAIYLTGWQTFFKNVLLLVAAVVVWWGRSRVSGFISEANAWALSLYTWVLAFCFASYNLYYLPVLDFRPFRIGANLREGVTDVTEARFETYFILEKDGVQQEFSLDNYPDSTWTFVDSRTVQIGGEEQQQSVQDFRIQDMQYGEDITMQVLQDTSYVFLLTSPYLELADDGVLDEIAVVHDYAQEYGYPFYCLTSSGDEAVTRWQEITGAEYQFCITDAVTLKTMVRSNPGLMLLHDGVVVNKWPSTSLPDEELLTAPLAELPVFSAPENGGKARLWLWLLLPIALLTIADRLGFVMKKSYLYININQQKRKTMRKKIVAGNWKMNKNLQEGVALATELKDMLAAEKPNCEVIIGTPFIHLATVSELLKDSVIAVSAENCANKESGAYTGEVSAAMVKSTGAEYVILGHSERREYYNETPEILKEKVDLALANGLKVIFCIGESLEQREANQQEAVCKAELAGSVFHLTAEQWKNVVIAYEPIWAIGTGKTATAEQAEEIHAYIRSCVAEVYGAEVADETSILYGGSCKASNAPELFAKADIDGGLIGGASLKAPDFKGIIDAWN